MLARSFRLRKSTDFNKVYKRGIYVGGKNLYARVLKTNLPMTRCAVVVSKKISKRAVIRNRARRRIIEIVRERWADIVVGFDIIIMVKSDLNSLSHTTLKNELTTILVRAKLYRK